MLRMNCICTEGRICGPAIVTSRDTLLHSSLCGCTAESLPPSAPRAPPILPTHSLCGCTAESLPPSAPRAPHGSILPACSRSSLALLPVDAPHLVLSAVVLWRAYLSKCSYHQAPPHAPHAPHAPPHTPPHAPPCTPHTPPHAPPHAPPRAPRAPPHNPRAPSSPRSSCP